MTVKDYIKESGFKQTFIAKHLGISNGSLQNRLNGLYPWTVSDLDKLSDLLRVPVADLIEATK